MAKIDEIFQHVRRELNIDDDTILCIEIKTTRREQLETISRTAGGSSLTMSDVAKLDPDEGDYGFSTPVYDIDDANQFDVNYREKGWTHGKSTDE